MEKIANWQSRYAAFMSDAQSRPFKWFDHDCVTFAAKALDVQYDIGLMDYINTNLFYEDEQTAIAMIDEHGGLELLVCDVLGIDPIPPALLTTGDVVIYAYDRQPNFPYALAVHDGHQLVLPGTNGLISLKLDRALKGWRV